MSNFYEVLGAMGASPEIQPFSSDVTDVQRDRISAAAAEFYADYENYYTGNIEELVRKTRFSGLIDDTCFATFFDFRDPDTAYDNAQYVLETQTMNDDPHLGCFWDEIDLTGLDPDVVLQQFHQRYQASGLLPIIWLIGQKVWPIFGVTAGGAFLFREKVETVQLFRLDKKCV